MQLLLFDNPNNIELFCPHCLQQSNFYKNEDFTPSDDLWVVQCEKCNFVAHVEHTNECDSEYYTNEG